MARRRKHESTRADLCARKRNVPIDGPVKQDLLGQAYSTVLTLREYALRKLPSSSRLRRKKVGSIGLSGPATELDLGISRFLDSTLVCSCAEVLHHDDSTYEQWLSFSQRGADDSHVTINGGVVDAQDLQSQIVDFVIWLLFNREKRPGRWPQHLLCDGFRKRAKEGDPADTCIPGIYSLYPNHHTTALKNEPWPHLLALLGSSGESIMLDLLTERSVFLAVDAGLGNYHQLSGFPLSELDLGGQSRVPSKPRGLSDIILVRSRIFYAKPALTVRGRVQPGYKHIHVLNRCVLRKHSQSSVGVADDNASTSKVMMYIFPRQFGLHNVFTSHTDPQLTAQRFQDYTSREEEIASFLKAAKGQGKDGVTKLPRRLRGLTLTLVQRLQVLHSRCSYFELLKHYCPSRLDSASRQNDAASIDGTTLRFASGFPQREADGTDNSEDRSASNMGCNQPRPDESHSGSVLDLAASISQVSAFCQAVLASIVPNGFWGEGETLAHNKAAFLRKVDHFIQLRRFESMSLHEVAQDLKITDVQWLQPPDSSSRKMSRTDMDKRWEIFHELLYYIFDSLLIPLLRANFYVTESSTHRYRIFYFRHDVWRRVAVPTLSTLKRDMFEEMRLKDVHELLDSRRLGFSHMRLLPKANKLRPIMNLRRRQVNRNNSKSLQPSINSILGPVHSALKHEKGANPHRLGSALFSVSDMYTRLKNFKQLISSSTSKRFFFAKVDVQSAFDTIPQDAVMRLMRSIPSQSQYTLTKHAEVQPGERSLAEPAKAGTKAIRRWRTSVLARDQKISFATRLHKGLAENKKHTVFVDGVAHRSHSTAALLSLLTSHVESNVVKIGKKYYRQKRGIPQGSVVSSLLCNYFYADLEKTHLSFVTGTDCLLMRLIDDFLLITLDKDKAAQFVRTMHGGFPGYGVQVSAHKTLVNFDMVLDGELVCKSEPDKGFPYCGTRINDKTLDITKDFRDTAVVNTLTVDFGRSQGQNFQRKILNAFKIQSHLMFFDTAHNSITTVLHSLHCALLETARKMRAYLQCMPKTQKPSSRLIIGTICKVAQVSFSILSGKSRRLRYPEYACAIRRDQVTSVAYDAFLAVLLRHQTNFAPVIEWLRSQKRSKV